MSAEEIDPLDSGAVDWVFDGQLEGQGWSRSELVRLARVLSRECPHCGAPAGRWCLTRNGRLIRSLDELHVLRRMPAGPPYGLI